MKKIDFELPLSECGTHVGCFRQPHSCAIEHCDVAITWKVVVNETKGATPASRILMYKKGNGWIGFGFSQDRIMVSGLLTAQGLCEILYEDALLFYCHSNVFDVRETITS